MAHKGWTKAKPKTIDDYLARLPADQRDALEKLRRTIHTVAPGVEECISYSLPAFRLNGTLVAGFGAGAKHPVGADNRPTRSCWIHESRRKG